MFKRTHILPALAATAACLCASPAASAESVRLTHYELTFDVRVDYQHATAFSAPHQSSHTKMDLSTHLLGRMDVTFANGRLQPTQGGEARGFTTAEYKADGTDLSSHGTEHCTANPSLPVSWGAPSIGDPELAPLVNPEIYLRLSESSLMATSWDSCSGSLGAPAFPDMGDPSKELGQGPLDAVFTMPTDAIGNGKIIQLVSGPPKGSASFCPGNEDQTTTSCTYGWNGTVTLTKKSETLISDGDAAQIPSKGSAPSRGSGTKTKPAASTSSKAKADSKGKTITFDADCPLGCAGIAHLNFGKGRAAAAKAPAGMRFKVKAGRRKVTLKVPASQRRKLRKAGKANLKVQLTPKGGARVTRTLRVGVSR